MTNHLLLLYSIAFDVSLIKREFMFLLLDVSTVPVHCVYDFSWMYLFRLGYILSIVILRNSPNLLSFLLRPKHDFKKNWGNPWYHENTETILTLMDMLCAQYIQKEIIVF